MKPVYLVMMDDLASELPRREVDSIHLTRETAVRRARLANLAQRDEEIQVAYSIEEWEAEE